MTGFVVASAILFSVVAPVGMGLTPESSSLRGGPRSSFISSFVVTLLALSGASAASSAILRGLSVSVPSFELGAAIALLPLALRRVITGSSSPNPPDDPSALSRMTRRLLGGPAALFAAAALASRFGLVATCIGAAVSTSLSLLIVGKLGDWERRRPRGGRWVGRLFGVMLLCASAGFVHDWLFTV